MKTIAMLFLVGLIGLTACNTEGVPGPKGDTGAQGPKGDTGSQGPKGDSGTVNARSYIYANQQFNALGTPNYDATTKLFTYNSFRTYSPQNYAAIADKGVVLVYLRDQLNAWTLNTIRANYLNVGVSDSPSVIESVVRPQTDKVQIMAKLTTPLETNLFVNYRFDVKIILIEPTHSVIGALRMGQVDVKDSRNVERFFNLKHL
ncbi:collagen-like triple helix repeat-containing protein [Runella aurantiaca]|uniref:Collagen-like protein n=1 Tax=Runella aurantiaca TaxID=2282308 RepID=A0A369IFE9_9BACT|nr:collagen-like protein [Runella aurantiaca]RDB07772.1 collagen-like protein [Runella aurantiaca]